MRTERQRRAIAYHEAEHAAMRLKLGRRLVRDLSLGICQHQPIGCEHQC